MLRKVLMCECFYQIFQSEGGSYKTKYLHFHCRCKEKRLPFVLFCDWHPYGADSNQEMTGQKCTCAALTHDEICGFCIHVRYILIFKFLKLCVKKIPKILTDCVQTTPQYFAKIKSCDIENLSSLIKFDQFINVANFCHVFRGQRDKCSNCFFM